MKECCSSHWITTIWNTYLSNALANCHTPEFESASDVLSITHSVLWNTPRNAFNRKIFFSSCHFLRDLILFITITFTIHVGKSTLVKFLWPPNKSLLNGSSVNIPMASYFFYTSIHVQFFLCMSWIKKYAVTCHQQILKEVMSLVPDHDVYLLFTQWYVDWQASSEVCTYAIIHGLYSVATEIWLCCSGTGVV